MALELGRRGAKVIVNYANSSEFAEEVVAAIKKGGSDAVSIRANVSIVDEIVSMFEEAVKAFGKLDIVCSNSGVVSFGHVKDVTPEEFDRVFNINTRGQFFVAREAYKHLEIGGRLILMGSITGQAKGVPRHAVYSGSKGTIETFVRCMAIGKCSALGMTSFPWMPLLTTPRLWRQEDHRQRRCPWRHPHRHVPRRLSRVYPQRRLAQQRRG
jgi:tetrahydroxynaphthalene reductase